MWQKKIHSKYQEHNCLLLVLDDGEKQKENAINSHKLFFRDIYG